MLFLGENRYKKGWKIKIVLRTTTMTYRDAMTNSNLKCGKQNQLKLLLFSNKGNIKKRIVKPKPLYFKNKFSLLIDN